MYEFQTSLYAKRVAVDVLTNDVIFPPNWKTSAVIGSHYIGTGLCRKAGSVLCYNTLALPISLKQLMSSNPKNNFFHNLFPIFLNTFVRKI